MKRFCQLAVVCLLASVPSIPFFVSGATNPDVLAELRDHWMFAMKEGDAPKLSSLFAENATLMPAGFPSFTGRKAIESFYRDGFAVARVLAAELHPKEHRAGANSVREHGIYKITLEPIAEEEPPYIMQGRYLFICGRRPDGKWEILWEMHTIENKVPVDQL